MHTIDYFAIAANRVQTINHYTSLNLTKLDVLDTFPTIKVRNLSSSGAARYELTHPFHQVAVGYRDPETGVTLDTVPADISVLDRVEPVYEELEGWNKPTT